MRSAVIVLALTLAGCAPLSPGATQGSSTSAPLARAERTHEYPAAAGQPAPADPPATSGAGDPITAIRAFAAAYINWTAVTVTARLRALAALSVGQAQAALTLAASQTAADYELRRGGVGNHGTVEAVAPISGQTHRYVVVTRELTTATATAAYRGLRPAWHVTLATATRVGAGWVLSGWQPEN